MNDYQRLLRNSIVALLIGTGLVLICYLWVDRPVAFFVHRQNFAQYALLKWPTYPPPILQAWAPVVLVVLMIRRACGPFRRWECAVLAACVSIVLADQFRESLSYVCGRYWPETWTHDNPSLIRDGAYGFHPFHHEGTLGSFPSGHATRTLAVAAIGWIAYPKGRWAYGLVCLAVAVGLIGMDYHFVGDVIAGSIIGAIVGTYMAYFFGLGNTEEKE